MSIEVETSEIERFTPPVLGNLPAPPVFLLRPASEREWRRYQRVMREEGLQYHRADEFREEILNGLRSLWSAEEFEPNAARLRAHWELLDQKGTPSPEDAAAVEELTRRLAKSWKPLAAMAADNMEFAEDSMKIALSMFLVGWSGADIPYGREEGRVPLAKLDRLEDWLRKQEEGAVEARIEGLAEPGTAFIQLCNAAYARLGLTEDEEKNSSSPPPASPDRNGSTKTRSARTAGARSKASASSSSARTES